MTGPAPGAPEPVTETWTYGGIRADKDGKKWHAWVDPVGEEHWFAKTGGRMAVGSRYTARVTRRDDGGISLRGTPEYAGSQADRETRAALWTAHTLAQTRIESLRAERDAASRNGRARSTSPVARSAASNAASNSATSVVKRSGFSPTMCRSISTSPASAAALSGSSAVRNAESAMLKLCRPGSNSAAGQNISTNTSRACWRRGRSSRCAACACW